MNPQLSHGPIARVVRAWVSLVVRFAWAVVISSVVLLVSLGWYAGTHLGIDTSTADMIAERLPWRQAFREYRELFPQLDHTLLAVIDAPDADHADDARDALYGAALARPDLFSEVFAPGSDVFFRRNALLYLEQHELEDLSDRLSQVQPFLARLARDPTAAGLFNTLGNALTIDGPEIDVTPLLGDIADVVESVSAGQPEPLSWQALMAGPDNAASRRSVVILRPRLDFSQLQPAHEAIAMVRAQQQVISTALPGDISIRLTGPVALEYEELASVSKGTRNAGLLALLTVLIILYAGLRSTGMVFAVLTTLIGGLLATAAFAAAAVGALNLISIAFAVLYVGLGVDFAIHYCLRYREACGNGADRQTALIESSGDVGTSLVLCALTTSIGFFAFFPTTFRGVSELGIISGIGMYISLLLSLTLLPALLRVLPSPAAGKSGSGAVAVIENLSRKRWLLPVAALASAAAVATLPLMTFDSDPLNLRDPASESVATFRELLDDPLYSPRTLSLVAVDAEVAQGIRQQAMRLSAVTQVRSIDDFVPGRQPQKLQVIEDIAWLVGPDLQPVAVSHADDGRTRAAIGRLMQALAGRDGPAQRLREALAQVDVQQFPVLDAMLTGSLPRRLQALDDGLAAERVSLETLPEQLRERWVSADGRQRIELRSDRPPAEFVKAVRTVLPQATGLPVVQLEAGSAVVGAFRQAFATALVVIGVILFMLLRDWRQVLAVLLPMLAAAAFTVAAMAGAGQSFNFANVIALPLLLGVGVDNGIHMVHRWRSTGVNLLRSSTTRAILFSALTTIASFGNLAFSTHPGSASMGKVLATGMLFTTVSTIVLIPALLHRLRR
ncbi:MAG: MMPL family transporter [Gammaproteobacteria bacterium]|nr:MMPL family transporter [Gammaproteobacteria bacterium]NNF62189.1 MMPL family transporter [Gammaproteobacteria bacterium]NNM20126.1 MMPL family transporter [Gammaproteobacteria bacterium]